ncbi:MAG: glycoside hydrolase family 172 protein, partial [Candidatus Aminicenantes bacterium]
GQDYLILETKGKGHFVGAVLGVRMRSPAWFGEGDEKITIDGETTPSIWGTGTEDYFLSAWGLERTLTPYFGVPFFDQRTIGGHVSSYRWHLYDPVVFNTGIKVTMEHMGWMSEDENPEYKATSWNEREDDYSSVAFWYQTGEPTFGERAPGAGDRRLPVLDRAVVRARDFAASQRHAAGELRVAESAFYGGGVLVFRPSRAAGTWLEFPVEVGAKEPLRLAVNAERSPDGGLYQVFLDGVKIGRPLDFFSEEPSEWTFHLIDFWPEPGRYVLRLENVGKDPKSTGYACGVESVRLLERRPRVAEYGHDKDKDWRKAPILYY